VDTTEQAILDETPKRMARRRRSVEEKRRIVEETLEAGASVARISLDLRLLEERDTRKNVSPHKCWGMVRRSFCVARR
jgi:hypothetical protein